MANLDEGDYNGFYESIEARRDATLAALATILRFGADRWVAKRCHRILRRSKNIAPLCCKRRRSQPVKYNKATVTSPAE
ncbi:hypothetical protein U1Q18_051815, partial [Sarracenia purpurea var. burkii]